MIVVDSSVLISNLREFDTLETRKFKSLTQGRVDAVLVGDIVLLEVLRGARSARHAESIESELRCFPVVTMLNADLAVRAASNYRKLREIGVTIRKTVDLIIGTFCIEHRYALLHHDRDFEPMRQHLGLQTA